MPLCRLSSTGSRSTGLSRFEGLVWRDLVWSDLVWSGLVWSDLVWSDLGSLEPLLLRAPLPVRAVFTGAVFTEQAVCSARALFGQDALFALQVQTPVPGRWCAPYAGGLPYGPRLRPEVVLFVNEPSGAPKPRRRRSRAKSRRHVGSSSSWQSAEPAEPLRAEAPAVAFPMASPKASPRPSRRAVSRQFARASARIERSAEYRHTFQVVLDLSAELQRVLEAPQRERWLALEDALLEHSSRLYRAYFRAGLECGRERSAYDRSGAGSGRLPSPVQLELLAAFARLIGLY